MKKDPKTSIWRQIGDAIPANFVLIKLGDEKWLVIRDGILSYHPSLESVVYPETPYAE